MATASRPRQSATEVGAGSQARVEVLPEAAWRRCYVHFLRNAFNYVPRKVDDDCLRELRWPYDRRDLTEARRDLAAWLAKWQATYPKLCSWVEEHIEARLAPRDDHQGRPGAAR